MLHIFHPSLKLLQHCTSMADKWGMLSQSCGGLLTLSHCEMEEHSSVNHLINPFYGRLKAVKLREEHLFRFTAFCVKQCAFMPLSTVHMLWKRRQNFVHLTCLQEDKVSVETCNSGLTMFTRLSALRIWLCCFFGSLEPWERREVNSPSKLGNKAVKRSLLFILLPPMRSQTLPPLSLSSILVVT